MNVVFVIIFAILLCAGLPIYLTLGLTSMIMLALYSPTPLIMIPEVMYNSLGGFTLLAIPFFVIAAQFMLKGGTSRYLIDLANSAVGHWRGGLAIVCVLSCIFFGAICGSSVASAMAMGVILIPAMTKKGYSPSFATGVVASSGTMAIMIPPSITMILYGTITEQSIPRLFFGGIIPGLLQGGLYVAWIFYYSKRRDYRGGDRVPFGQTLRAAGKAIPALCLPIIILGGIYSGIVTVTEASALAAGASIVIALFIYREVKPREVFAINAEAMKTTAMIMIIIATASVFGHWVTHAGITADLVTFVRKVQMAPWMFLLFVNILLLFLGMFLEVVSIVLITMPLLFPVATELGIDPIHFGVMLVANMELALITPPVGLNLYVLTGVAKISLSQVIRGAWPFIALGFILLAMLTYYPPVILFLPNLLMAH